MKCLTVILQGQDFHKPLFKSRVCLQAIPMLPCPLRQDNLKQSGLLQFFGIQSGDLPLSGVPQTLRDVVDCLRVAEQLEFRSGDLGDRLQQDLTAVVPIETDPFTALEDFADGQAVAFINGPRSDFRKRIIDFQDILHKTASFPQIYTGSPLRGQGGSPNSG